MHDDIKQTTQQAVEKIESLKASSLIKFLLLTLAFILLADLAILLNIPILRQVLGLLLIAVLPGLLILFLLKLDKLGTAGKIVLTIGLSTAFLMFFGLILNQISLQLGYVKPLSTNTLILSLSGVLVVLAMGAYIRNKEAFSSSTFHLELNTGGKLCLLLTSVLPLLSILGTYYLNISNNNGILLTFLFLVPVSIILITFLRGKISKDTYPIAIIMIGTALLIMFWLRSEHVIGHDIHLEYYLFHTTYFNSHWGILEGSTLDTCLSITLLPTIFQSLLHLPSEEYLFVGVYAFLCAFIPLTVYEISKKHLGEPYAMLAAFFLIAQTTFLGSPGSPRTSLAIFFFALCIMILYHNEITGVNRRGLFLIFGTATIVSHYSTTYIFLFLLLTAFLLSLILRKYCLTRIITLSGVAFLVLLSFLWYNQMIQAPFESLVSFISITIRNVPEFFLAEARSPDVGVLFSAGIGEEILFRIHYVFTWATFVLVGAGVVGTFLRRKEMILSPQHSGSSPEFLQSRFKTEYFLLALMCSAVLVATVALPQVTISYGMKRVYTQVAIVLSPFFVAGGMLVSKYLKASSHLLILLVLVLTFLFITGAAYEVFGSHVSFLLHSEAPDSSYELVYDQEIPAALWLEEHIEQNSTIYTTDWRGSNKLTSQGKISWSRIDSFAFFGLEEMDGYIYLYHNNVVNHKMVYRGVLYDMSEQHLDLISGKNKLYSNGGSEIYR